MKKKILGIFVSLLAVVMLASPLVVCVSAKPVVWSVEFSFSTLPDMISGDLSKFKMVETRSGLVKVDHIPTIGDDLVLDYDDGTTQDTLSGEVSQMVITSKLFEGDPFRVMGNEKWVFTFDDAEASTLEISAVFWMDDMLTQPNGWGKCVGTSGTGIFEGAKFKGTFDTEMYIQLNGILKLQYGEGEIKFP
jgi:hypothetical protein